MKINPRRPNIRIQADRDYVLNNLDAAVRLLDQEAARQSARGPKSGPWGVWITKKGWITSARFAPDGVPLPSSIVLVNVRGGAHGFSFEDAGRLQDYFGGDKAQLEMVV